MQIAVIGAGAVGQAFAQRLATIGYTTYLVHRPHQQLALSAVIPLSDWADLPWADLDYLVLCVKDYQISPLVETWTHLYSPLPPLAHTAGSTPIEVLGPGPDKGVLYPLQTFSVGQTLTWGRFPIFWEGAPCWKKLAIDLAGTDAVVYPATSAQRLRLHIGAVFAANFVNALVEAAAQLATPDWDHHIYLPLIQTVVEKLAHMTPRAAQTGPAKRGDLLTIQKHLTHLAQYHPALVPIYEQLTAYIQAQSLQ